MTELLLGILLSAPFFPFVLKRLQQVQGSEALNNITSQGLYATIRIGIFGLVFYFSIITLASRAYNPFLYFQF